MMTNNKDKSAIRTDLFFAILGIAGVALLVQEGSREGVAVSAPAEPMTLALVAIAAMAGIAMLISLIVRVDQRKTDEYVFLIIGQSAIIAVVTAIATHALLGQGFLLGGTYGRISADSLMAVLIGAWSIGYFTYRIRGTVS